MKPDDWDDVNWDHEPDIPWAVCMAVVIFCVSAAIAIGVLVTS